MTDVPRRSYPLVVPPPGGFEDAVGRGRRLRRRKASGTTGAALALVGLIAYGSVSGDQRKSGLEQTHNPPPPVGPSYHPGDASPTPDDTAAPESPGPSGSSAPKPGTGSDPAPSPTGVATAPPVTGAPTARPTRQPRQGRPYAPRPVITEHREELAGTSACLPGELWCAYADVNVTTGATGTRYTLVYGLCRSVDAVPGEVHFDRLQRVDYAAIDTRGDADPSNDDTVWTYSAGQRVVPANGSVTINPGYCVEWTTDWDGYDDFGYTPPDGDYLLRARSLGTSDTVLPTRETTFEHA